MRCAAATHTSTATAASTTAGSSCWPNSTTDSATVSSGCASCTWLILAMPPSASPRYHAKKPRNMLTRVELPEGCDDVDLAARASARGVLVGAGRPYFVSEPPRPHLRLSYAGMASDRMDGAVRRLAELLV